MKSRLLYLMACAMGCLAAFQAATYAQGDLASVTGRVFDPNAAVIIEAMITARNLDTGIETVVQTNQDGIYRFANLGPGNYELSVSKRGFKVVLKRGVALHVGDAVSMNFTMEVGAASETVRVEGGAPLVNTENASVSTVVERHFVESIPLNGRSLQPLIGLTPGVVLTPVTGNEQGQFSVNGQRADANYFMVDGVSANFGVSGSGSIGQATSGALPGMNAFGGTNSLVSIDAIQEFRIQTSSYAPEFGRVPGGQISILTRSGTNEFHGTAFEYFRNDVLDANDWFSNAFSLPKAPERQNDFGGVFGGPIRRDKTFFFFSYEGLRLLQPVTGSATYPTTAFRNSASAAWVKPLLDAFPIPNGDENNDGCTVSTPSGPAACDAQFHASYSNPTSLNATSIRIDHKLNGRISLFGRYNYAPSETSQRITASSSVLKSKFPIQTLTLGSTQVASATLSNEFRFNYSAASKESRYFLDGIGGAVPPSDSIIFPAGFSPNNSRFQFLTFGDGDLFWGLSPGERQKQFNVVDGLSLMRGTHQFKFGFDYRRLATDTDAEPFVQTAESLGLGGPPLGVQSGSFPLYITNAFGNYNLAFQNFSTYAQDTWKLNSRITLTYGVRWDVNPPFRASGAPGIFTVQNTNDPPNVALAPPGTSFYETTWHNLAPRLGIAAHIFDKPGFTTVLRAGFGIFYDIGAGSLAQSFSSFPNRQETDYFFQGVTFPVPANFAVPPAFTTTIPPGGVTQIYASDPDLQLPRTYQWNIALQQALGGNQSMTFTYVGAIGRDLLRTFDLFQPNPQFRNVNILQNSATSDYHALQVQYQMRLFHGLQALGFYAFSHSLDDASNDFSLFGSDAHLDRGNSDFDIRHVFHGVLTYAIPTPNVGHVGKAVMGGWSTDITAVAQSAPPIDLQSGLIILAGNQSFTSRPDLVSNQSLYLYGSQCAQVLGAPCAGGKGINPAAFSLPPANQQGTLGRNVLRGFGVSQLDLSLRRRFSLTESWSLQFSAEFFNVLNHPNFGSSSIDTNLSHFPGLFGQAQQILASALSPGQGQGGFNPLYQVGGPRSIQLALKLAF